jgi:hypothetical protein
VTGSGGEAPDGTDLASEELLAAVRVVRRGAGHPALAAAVDWDDRLYDDPLDVVAERFDVRPEDVRMLTLALTAIRSYGLDPRQVAAFTDPAVSDRAVVACWSAGLSAQEIDDLVAGGAVPDEATLATLAALRRGQRGRRR